VTLKRVSQLRETSLGGYCDWRQRPLRDIQTELLEEDTLRGCCEATAVILRFFRERYPPTLLCETYHHKRETGMRLF
jgi:hypothetical protein